MTAQKRKRYLPKDRRRMIIDGAKAFFAEFGFDGSTHQLAQHLGMTQPLLYQYFPTKEDLIDAVYEEVFEQRWEGDWNKILDDRGRSLNDRLVDFYTQYCAIVHAPEWARIYLFAGLRSKEINQKYNPKVETRIIQKICNELRVSTMLPELDTLPPTPRELETIWTVHGGVFYYGVRRGIYEVPVNADLTEVIRASVALLLNGYPAVAPALEQ